MNKIKTGKISHALWLNVISGKIKITLSLKNFYKKFKKKVNNLKKPFF